MIEIKKLVRQNILSLTEYSNARNEYKGKEGVFLDANESPFGKLNRYPDPNQTELKRVLGALKSISTDSIFIGNGSDEVIDLTFRIFCNPGTDKVIVCPPTYGMYEVSANINAVEVISIPLFSNFQLDIDKILSTEAKAIFICSPNNPTGNQLYGVETILKQFKGIVFIDEAYIDFSKQASFIKLVNEYPNLIVSQTLSKAWGLAAARIGIAYACKETIELFQKVKPPYNVSLLNQQAAIEALKNTNVFEFNVNQILEQRRIVVSELQKMDLIKKVFPSDANFVLVEVMDARQVYERLISKKIITRNRSSVISNCIRITVGAPEENSKLINELKNIKL